MLYLLEWPVQRHITEDREREKSLAAGGIQTPQPLGYKVAVLQLLPPKKISAVLCKVSSNSFTGKEREVLCFDEHRYGRRIRAEVATLSYQIDLFSIRISF